MIPRKQIGWSQEENLLWEISKQLDKTITTLRSNGTTTITTTTIPVYEPRYTAILDYATSQEFTLPSTEQNIKNNTKIIQLQQEGIFDELDILYNFKQPAGLEDFCRINWVNPGTYNATQSNPSLAPTFEADKGFKGTAGLGTYFSTNYIPSINATNAVLNDMGAFFKTYDEVGGVVAGTRNGAGNNFNIRKAIPGEGAGGNYTALCSVTNDDLKAFNDASHIVHAKNGLTHSYYVNGVFNTSATYASTTLSSVQLTLFAWNLNGAINQFFTGGIEYFGLGSSIVGTKAAALASIFSE
jgi:hypothetical protein